MSNNAHELSKRLLNALDTNYNVVDMHAVNEIISILEKINITKELLETTRLGKHVNELRRRTSDAALARRAKVLVKRWRDLVIPNAVASPAHTGSNRSSAERAVRGARLGGTPLTSPALPLSRQVLSPVVISSPRPPSRPAWGGYESDSQDVILVDDDPPPPPVPPAPAAPTPHTPSKRLASPAPSVDEKKAKRDKKPKKKRGHSRAGTGAETVCDGTAGGGAWGARNGVSPSAPLAAVPPALTTANAAAPTRRNGCRRNAVDAYAALVNKIPAAGVKKVKTTQELLEEIQSRGRPASPASPHSPDVVLVEPEPSPIEVESPLRNGGSEPVELLPAAGAPLLTVHSPSPPLRPVLEDERPYAECTCGEEPDEDCPAAAVRRTPLTPRHVHALHHALLPGVNGTRAPLHPHRFAVRPAVDPDRPDLFANVVPLFKYSDYADDYCVKNLARVPLASHLPWTEFAPPPPDPPPPPAPPPPRPYPLSPTSLSSAPACTPPHLKSEPTTPPDACDRLETPPDTFSDGGDGETWPATPSRDPTSDVNCEPTVSEFQSEAPDHRTVERAKAPPSPCASAGLPGSEMLSGRTIYELWERARAAAVYGYEQAGAAPTLALQAPTVACDETLQVTLNAATEDTARDALGRPLRHLQFAEWHECAQLGDLVALPYVVID